MMPESSPLISNGSESLATLFHRYADRLRKMVEFRMDRRLRGRLDPSDVVQEALLEATKRFGSRDESMSTFLWLRFLTQQKLVELHRTHVAVKARSVSREVRLHELIPVGSSQDWADYLAGDSSTPSERAQRLEVKVQVLAALSELDPISREVLAMRHFEQLSGAETAQLLGITVSAQSKRYIRALRKIKSAVRIIEPK